MADGVWKVIGHSKQLSLNKFFDPRILYIKKGREGEKKNKLGLSCAKLSTVSASCQWARDAYSAVAGA